MLSTYYWKKWDKAAVYCLVNGGYPKGEDLEKLTEKYPNIYD